MYMIKHSEQRVAVFIDTQNMYYSARNLYGARVNFKNIVEDAVAGRKLTRAIAYVVATKTGEERPFFEALKGAGIETKEKELQIYAGGVKKADWDVGIAVDAIKLADKVDAVVIASGDGDFAPLLEYLSGVKGCLVEVMSFRETTSSKLLGVVDDFTDLSQNKDRYLMKVGSLRTETEDDKGRGRKTKSTRRGKTETSDAQYSESTI
ncbi:NYN domain-containing protein, partial [Candidatus Uhrbacteria bacterium]|nr:NYN domain-containing protein [Candidatus Uhrbacteria bacterium]